LFLWKLKIICQVLRSPEVLLNPDAIFIEYSRVRNTSGSSARNCYRFTNGEPGDAVAQGLKTPENPTGPLKSNMACATTRRCLFNVFSDDRSLIYN